MTTQELIDALFEYQCNDVGGIADTAVCESIQILEQEHTNEETEEVIGRLSDELICLTSYIAAIAVVRDRLKEDLDGNN